MNVVFLSPNFPQNYFNFCVKLRSFGANVLGLGDAPYDWLRHELKTSLSEYYHVTNLKNYDELIQAMGFFIHRYGKVDWLDSLNEFWIASEAHLRTDFNIDGMLSICVI